MTHKHYFALAAAFFALGSFELYSANVLSKTEARATKAERNTQVLISNAYQSYKAACLTGLNAGSDKVDLMAMQLCEDEARRYAENLKKELL